MCRRIGREKFKNGKYAANISSVQHERAAPQRALGKQSKMPISFFNINANQIVAEGASCRGEVWHKEMGEGARNQNYA